jgi:hypothetical protein
MSFVSTDHYEEAQFARAQGFEDEEHWEEWFDKRAPLGSSSPRTKKFVWGEVGDADANIDPHIRSWEQNMNQNKSSKTRSPMTMSLVRMAITIACAPTSTGVFSSCAPPGSTMLPPGDFPISNIDRTCSQLRAAASTPDWLLALPTR